ncbi:hypothetical protein C8R44DRAFT_742027 [Mycena epipterygia]|nr:hypothetical protein C8R44DRAFT_742027 [Mycena epipterygia]
MPPQDIYSIWFLDSYYQDSEAEYFLDTLGVGNEDTGPAAGRHSKACIASNWGLNETTGPDAKGGGYCAERTSARKAKERGKMDAIDDAKGEDKWMHQQKNRHRSGQYGWAKERGLRRGFDADRTSTTGRRVARRLLPRGERMTDDGGRGVREGGTRRDELRAAGWLSIADRRDWRDESDKEIKE